MIFNLDPKGIFILYVHIQLIYEKEKRNIKYIVPKKFTNLIILLYQISHSNAFPRVKLFFKWDNISYPILKSSSK